ncbi:MAG: hypothetical protein PHF86_14265 [Candidatus Nanoarchaeia archaeon]|jgi:hypothetical protein|nr:hypothetical protein [Candidatus Nanoarchaeia archaeon]
MKNHGTINLTEQLKSTLSASTLSKKSGVYTARWSYFYTSGITSDHKVAKVKSVFPQATIIDSGDVWKPFKGGASVANQSHWYVKFTL